MKFIKQKIFNRKDLDRLIENRLKILIFDYDGTLAPFVKEREKAYMYSGFPELINKLHDYFRIYFVSGRSVGSLKNLLEVLDFQPDIWGSHGNEFLSSSGTYTDFTEDNSDILENIWNYFQFEHIREHTERKVASIALHYREVPDTVKEKIILLKDKVGEFFSDIHINDFDGGFEISIPSNDKGFAVSRIISLNPGYFPVYFGDDYTDENAFRVIMDNGAGFLVRDSFRDTDAHVWLNSGEELKELLYSFLKEVECQKEG